MTKYSLYEGQRGKILEQFVEKEVITRYKTFCRKAEEIDVTGECDRSQTGIINNYVKEYKFCRKVKCIVSVVIVVSEIVVIATVASFKYDDYVIMFGDDLVLGVVICVLQAIALVLTMVGLGYWSFRRVGWRSEIQKWSESIHVEVCSDSVMSVDSSKQEEDVVPIDPDEKRFNVFRYENVDVVSDFLVDNEGGGDDSEFIAKYGEGGVAFRASILYHLANLSDEQLKTHIVDIPVPVVDHSNTIHCKKMRVLLAKDIEATFFKPSVSATSTIIRRELIENAKAMGMTVKIDSVINEYVDIKAVVFRDCVEGYPDGRGGIIRSGVTMVVGGSCMENDMNYLARINDETEQTGKYNYHPMKILKKPLHHILNAYMRMELKENEKRKSKKVKKSGTCVSDFGAGASGGSLASGRGEKYREAYGEGEGEVQFSSHCGATTLEPGVVSQCFDGVQPPGYTENPPPYEDINSAFSFTASSAGCNGGDKNLVSSESTDPTHTSPSV